VAEVFREVRAALKRLEEYYYGRKPPHALCLFRILWGIYFLIAWLWKLPHVALYYSNEGMAFPYFDVPDGPIRGPDDIIAIVTQAPPPAIAWLLYVISGAAVVLFLVGWWARPALLFTTAFSSYYYFLQLHSFDSSFDRALFVITFLLAMSRCDEVYSIKAWHRRRSGQCADDTIPAWPQRLIMLQIVAIYFGTGVYKVMTPDWSTGEILMESLQGDWGTSVGFWFVNLDLPAATSSLLVLQTILMEIWSPFLLFHRVLRNFFFIWGTCFHVGIAIMLTIPPFLFMPLSYPLFADPEWIRRACVQIEGRVDQALRNRLRSVEASTQ